MAPLEHGPVILPGGVRFRVWAPKTRRVAVRTGGADHPLARGDGGWFEAFVPGIGDGARYALVLEGGAVRPDPASRRQPDGVHGSSQLFDPGRHAWTDAGWRGLAIEELV